MPDFRDQPRTVKELNDYAARLKQQAASGQLTGAELEAKIAELTQLGEQIQEEADELALFKRRRRLRLL